MCYEETYFKFFVLIVYSIIFMKDSTTYTAPSSYIDPKEKLISSQSINSSFFHHFVNHNFWFEKGSMLIDMT